MNTEAPFDRKDSTASCWECGLRKKKCPSSVLESLLPIHAGPWSKADFCVVLDPSGGFLPQTSSARYPERSPKKAHVHRRQPSRSSLRNFPQSQYQRQVEPRKPKFELKGVSKRRPNGDTPDTLESASCPGEGGSSPDRPPSAPLSEAGINEPSDPTSLSETNFSTGISYNNVQMLIEPSTSNGALRVPEVLLQSNNPDETGTPINPLHHHIPAEFLASLTSYLPGVSRIVIKMGEPEPSDVICSLMDQVNLRSQTSSPVTEGASHLGSTAVATAGPRHPQGPLVASRL